MTDKVGARDCSRARWLGFAELVRIIDEQTWGPVAHPIAKALRLNEVHRLCTRGLRGH